MKNTELEEFILENVIQYEEVKPLYENLAEILRVTLNKLAKSISSEFFVQVRAKEIASYAEKMIRKKWKKNPDYEMQDMCGSRVILSTTEKINEFQTLVEKHFICLENEDKMTTLALDQFGYLSVHYTIQVKPNSSLLREIINENVEELNLKKIEGKDEKDLDLYSNLKAELQVRTILQHSWSVNAHDSIYKSNINLPNLLVRKFQRIAAILEDVDQGLLDFSNQIQLYESNYGAYMRDDEVENLIKKNLAIYLALKKRGVPKEKLFSLAKEIVKHARYRAKWDLIIDILSNYKDMENLFVFREYGLALIKKHEPEDLQFGHGREMLEKACEIDSQDTDAITILGSTYKKEGKLSEALNYYLEAFKINPRDTYPIGNYFLTYITESKSFDIVKISSPILNQAIQTTKWQISHDINIPWAFYDNGFFNLLLGNVDQALRSYIDGIRFSLEEWMLDTNLNNLTLLESLNVPDTIPVNLVKTLLKLGLFFCFGREDIKKELDSSVINKFPTSVSSAAILAGSVSPIMQPIINKFHDIITKGFENFNGIVISGGLQAGANAIAGEIQELYPNNVETHGYSSSILPRGYTLDPRYSKISQKKIKFDQENVLQYWIDICCADIPSNSIKVLGISGGTIASLEYQMGLLFNASVGLLKDSAGEASKELQDAILYDPEHMKEKKHAVVQSINNDHREIKKFLESS